MSQLQESQPAPIPAAEADEPSRWWLAVLPVLFALIGCGFAPFMELSGDEAYYWSWSRHLAGGYLDHPPMAAWAIRLSTMILGNSELAVRLPGILLITGMVLAGIWTLSLFTRRFWDLFAVEVLLLAIPLTHVLASIITPDTPAAAFMMASIGCAVLCIKRPSVTTYLLLGVASGMAMLSKYTALIPVVALFVGLLIGDRRRLPRLVLAGLASCAIMTPLLLWNAQHDWISFRFQLSHGTKADDRLWALNLADYVGAQFLIATPILLPLMVYAGIRAFRGTDPGRRLLAGCGFTTLLFFGLTALSHKVEANWPMLAYPPLLVLLVLEVRSGRKPLVHLYKVGALVALWMSVAIHVPPSLSVQIAPRSPVSGIGGWKQLANQVRQMAGDRPILCTKYQDASLLEFYLRSRPQVTILREPDSRITQGDIIPGPRPSGQFLLVTDNGLLAAGSKVPFYWGEHKELIGVLQADRVTVDLDGIQQRSRFAVTCVALEGDGTAGSR